MTEFTKTVEDTWLAPFFAGNVLHDGAGFRLAVDVSAEPDRRVQILGLETRTLALLSPGVAALPGVKSATNESELRAAIIAAGDSMNGADHLFFLPRERREELRNAPVPMNVRRLTAADRAAFEAFESAAPAADIDEAYVELDHLVVFGAFDGHTLVAAGSAFPFDDGSLLADLGVVTLPSHRFRGHARAVIRALSRFALTAGLEPQYRCQLDNEASTALAQRSGFARLGTWDVASQASVHGES